MFDTKGFELSLLAGDRKRSTVVHHLKNLSIIENRFRSMQLSGLDQSNLEALILCLKREGRTSVYINHLIKTCRVYADFLISQNKLNEHNQLRDIHLLKERHGLKTIMSDCEIEAFLSLPATRKGEKEIESYARWTLFFSIMAFCGCRTTEVAHLTIDDVDFGSNTLLLRDTKTNDDRRVPIAPNIKSHLEEYLKTCPGPYLFPSRRGGNKDGFGSVVDNVDWHYNFHTRIKRLGIKRRGLTPYSLRHTLITTLLREDVAFPKVMKIAGHRRAETTLRYTHLITEDMQKAIRRHPLIRKATNPNDFLDDLQKVIEDFEMNKDPRFVNYRLVRTDKGIEFKVETKDDPDKNGK